MSSVVDRILASIRYLRHDPIGPFCTITSQLCFVNETLTDLERSIRSKNHDLDSIVAQQTVVLASADSPMKESGIKQTKANVDGVIAALPEVIALKEEIDILNIKKKNAERLERLLFEVSRFVTEYMKMPHKLYDVDDVEDQDLDNIKAEFMSKYGIGLEE